jgi:hypothetical protein
MKKVMLSIMFSVFFLTTQSAEAKMTIYSPQEMIANSDYVVVGKIKKNVTVTKNHVGYNEVIISLEAVLKGDIAQKEIVIRDDFRTDIINCCSGVHFDFPKNGTKVMLLLKHQYQLDDKISITNANSICVIYNNKVSLFKGTEFVGNWSTMDYEQAYQAMYDKVVSK